MTGLDGMSITISRSLFQTDHRVIVVVIGQFAMSTTAAASKGADQLLEWRLVDGDLVLEGELGQGFPGSLVVVHFDGGRLETGRRFVTHGTGGDHLNTLHRLMNTMIFNYGRNISQSVLKYFEVSKFCLPVHYAHHECCIVSSRHDLIHGMSFMHVLNIVYPLNIFLS